MTFRRRRRRRRPPAPLAAHEPGPPQVLLPLPRAVDQRPPPVPCRHVLRRPVRRRSKCAFDVDRPTEEEMEAFRLREEEFELVDAPFAELDTGVAGSGLLCAASTDAAFVERWGREAFDAKYVQAGVPTIWGYGPDSGIRPCPTYLRHCVLATSKEGVDPRARDSFLDETFLADRVTTVRQYLAGEQGSHVMDAVPPPSLVGRYSG